VLDIGTGCGIQALVAAGHAVRVVATDVNERALALAELNAQLNGIASLELRRGSLFEPVGDEQFDLIVSNAPYVVSPDTRFSYRDAGMRGDAFSEALVRGAAAHLAPGGTAVLLVAWLRRDGDDWSGRPRTWTRDTGCDVWVLGGPTADAETHAARWTDGDAATIARWVAELESLGASGVTDGAVLLRKPTADGPVHARADTVPPGAPVHAGEHVERAFANRDALRGLDDDGVLGLALRVAGDCVFEAAGPQVRVRLTSGLLFAAEIDPFTAGILQLFDGTRSTTEILAAAGFPRERHAELAPVVRELLELGFVAA
jgi:methylase of polypeptide subunit release factors